MYTIGCQQNIDMFWRLYFLKIPAYYHNFHKTFSKLSVLLYRLTSLDHSCSSSSHSDTQPTDRPSTQRCEAFGRYIAEECKSLPIETYIRVTEIVTDVLSLARENKLSNTESKVRHTGSSQSQSFKLPVKSASSSASTYFFLRYKVMYIR